MQCNKHNALILTAIISACLSSYCNATTEQELASARQAVKAFGGSLKSALMTAMNQGGPINAISAGHEKAPGIAEQISSESGWRVSRTSLKVRNAENRSDDWELEVLRDFEQRQQAGETVNSLEHMEVVTNNGDTTLRYMKAIPTGALCLNCHGENLADDVANKLRTLYPNDQATGFTLGDIRGAFSLKKSIVTSE